jgi:uncharacterized protein
VRLFLLVYLSFDKAALSEHCVNPADSDKACHPAWWLVSLGVRSSSCQVAFRTSVPGVAAHSARLQEFHARGDLLMAGTFGDRQNEGSMAIFTSREAAEEFVKDDPFVLNGVVRDWHIRKWHEVLAP